MLDLVSIDIVGEMSSGADYEGIAWVLFGEKLES